MERHIPIAGAQGPAGIDLWRVDLRAALDRHGDALALLLSADERERADRFVFARDRGRFVAARGALRRILADYAGIPPQELVFDYGPQGKPMLSPFDSRPAPRFNLSHSGDRALVAVTTRAEVGVDIECVRALPDMLGVIGIICAESEKQLLARLSETDRVAAFWSLWTAKEAVLKGEGCGFSRPPREVEFALSRRDHEEWTLTLQQPLGAAWRLVSLVPHEGHVAAVAVHADADPIIRPCRDFTPA